MKRRQGFTLVELLVSMALIIFIMAILSGAFQAALGTFRNLKAQGDLAEKLRATTQILQRDLAADHFEGTRRLSDPTFWNNGPPQQGFFRIWQSAPLSNYPGTTLEGSDLYDGIGSYITTSHFLAFTVKLRGNDMGDFFSASAAGGGALLSTIQTFGPPESRYQLTSGGSYNYQWAEVAWFLQPQINPTTGQPDTTAPDPAAGSSPVPLYTLYRRQRLLVPDNNLVTAGSGGGIPIGQAANCLELSCWANGTNLYFNSPVDITVPWRRFGMVPQNTYPGGLLYATVPPYMSPFAFSIWPTPPPQGDWVPPNQTPPPTYIPVPGIPQPYYPIPYYPTLAQQGATGTLFGADIQLNDVISFDVRVLVPGVTNGNDPFVTLFTVAGNYYNANPAFYNPTNPLANPSAPAVFDTWSSLNDGLSNYSTWNQSGSLTSIPLWNSATLSGPIIKAIQVTIRIWDFKTSQTRQVTIVQAM